MNEPKKDISGEGEQHRWSQLEVKGGND